MGGTAIAKTAVLDHWECGETPPPLCSAISCLGLPLAKSSQKPGALGTEQDRERWNGAGNAKGVGK